MEKTKLIWILVLIFFSCNRSLMMEKKLAGEWNIDSIKEGFAEIKYEFALNVINIIYNPKGGFVPEKLRDYKSENNELINYQVFADNNDHYIYFQTKNSFFNDTFKIEVLTKEKLILKNSFKRIECTRMY